MAPSDLSWVFAGTIGSYRHCRSVLCRCTPRLYLIQFRQYDAAQGERVDRFRAVGKTQGENAHSIGMITGFASKADRAAGTAVYSDSPISIRSPNSS